MPEESRKSVKVSEELYTQLAEEARATGKTIGAVLEEKLNAKDTTGRETETIAKARVLFTQDLRREFMKSTKSLSETLDTLVQAVNMFRNRRQEEEEEEEDPQKDTRPQKGTKSQKEEPEATGKIQELQKLLKEILELTDPTRRKLDIVHRQAQPKLQLEKENDPEMDYEARKNMLLALGYARATRAFLRRSEEAVFIREGD